LALAPQLESEILDDGREMVYVKKFDIAYLHKQKAEVLSELIRTCNQRGSAGNYPHIKKYLLENGVGENVFKSSPTLDCLVVTAYTGNDLYVDLNRQLNALKLDQQQRSFVQVLCRVIIRLQSSAPPPSVVYRKVECSDASILGYVDSVGKTFCFRTFVSTTKNLKVLDKWSGNLIFVFQVNERLVAADIQSFSHFKSEEEVLLIPNQLFRIVKFTREIVGEDKFLNTCTLECV